MAEPEPFPHTHRATPDSDPISPRSVCGEPVHDAAPGTLAADGRHGDVSCPLCAAGLRDVRTVQSRVEQIRRLRSADDMAHAAEDALHCDVLARIALGDLPAHQAAHIAEIALDTRDIDFSRWYA